MMRLRLIVLAVMAVLVGVSANVLNDQGEWSAERSSEPPHAQPGNGPGTFGTLPLAVRGADVEGTQSAVAIVAWAAGVEQAERERVDPEEREQAAAAAHQPAARTSSSSGGGGYPAECYALAAEFGVSPGTVWNESRCSADPTNENYGGCYGRGCVGPVQIDRGHFAAVSPWNPAVPGVCFGLDPSSYADQIECASRLPASAWG